MSITDYPDHPAGYVADSVFDASGEISVALGGLHYRLRGEGSGESLPRTPADRRAALAAEAALTQAKNRLHEAAVALEGLELGFSGHTRNPEPAQPCGRSMCGNPVDPHSDDDTLCQHHQSEA